MGTTTKTLSKSTKTLIFQNPLVTKARSSSNPQEFHLFQHSRQIEKNLSQAFVGSEVLFIGEIFDQWSGIVLQGELGRLLKAPTGPKNKGLERESGEGLPRKSGEQFSVKSPCYKKGQQKPSLKQISISNCRVVALYSKLTEPLVF